MNKPRFVPDDQVEFQCVCNTCGVPHWVPDVVKNVMVGLSKGAQAPGDDQRTWLYSIQKDSEPTLHVTEMEEMSVRSLEVPF